MEQEYNWNLIKIVSIPFSILTAIIFFTSLRNLFKWLLLILILIIAGIIIYYKDKKLKNISTASAIIIITAYFIYILKRLGVI